MEPTLTRTGTLLIDMSTILMGNNEYDKSDNNDNTKTDTYDCTGNNVSNNASSGDESIDTFRLGLFMGSVCTQLFCLVLVIKSHSVIAKCIQECDYDIILKALCVFICSILYWIFTIDGEYQNLQRIRILVDDIILYESSWNRALRLESYPRNSKQQQAAKRGERSQILHVM